MSKHLRRTIKRMKEIDTHLVTNMEHKGASQKEIDAFLEKRKKDRRDALKEVVKKKREAEKKRLEAERKARIAKFKPIQLKKK